MTDRHITPRKTLQMPAEVYEDYEELKGEISRDFKFDLTHPQALMQILEFARIGKNYSDEHHGRIVGPKTAVSARQEAKWG